MNRLSGYDFEEQEQFVPFYTQRNATYKDVAETKYQASNKEAFIADIEAPTPNIQTVDGYEAESEETSATSEVSVLNDDTDASVSETGVVSEDGDDSI